MMDAARDLLTRLYPLNRHNCSPGIDRALEIIKEFVPELQIHAFPSGQRVWTWQVPPKWDIRSGWVKDQAGRTILDFRDHPLHVWTCSRSVDETLTFDQLRDRLHYDPANPDLIPWKFKYYGEPTWGFSLSYEQYKQLDTNQTYRVHIDAVHYDDFLRFGTAFLQGESDRILLVASDICHPCQVNDSLTGAAVAYELYRRLRERRTHYSYLFTFGPEIIGTTAFFANNEHLIPKIDYGIYAEMLGHDADLVLQHSFQRHTFIDSVAAQVMLELLGDRGACRRYLLDDGPPNDEIVLCAPGVEIPSIAFNRGFFREYHSHKDNLELLDWSRIEEAFTVIHEVVSRMERAHHVCGRRERKPPPRQYSKYRLPVLPKGDYVPLPRFKGQVFLSRYGLYVDWRIDFKLSCRVAYAVTAMNGNLSCFDIAEDTGLDYHALRDYVDKFAEAGLIEKMPVRYVEDGGMVRWVAERPA